MPITLAEVLQISFDLVKRAEEAEAKARMFQSEVEKLKIELKQFQREQVHEVNNF